MIDKHFSGVSVTPHYTSGGKVAYKLTVLEMRRGPEAPQPVTFELTQANALHLAMVLLRHVTARRLGKFWEEVVAR
jgi:hypothetical protein